MYVCVSINNKKNYSSDTSFNDLNTFRSIIEKMSSSSDNELPEIPGTRFPWMDEAGSSSTSRSLRKQPKRHRFSAVEKERLTYKDSKNKKSFKLDSSSDDEFANPKPGPSNNVKGKSTIPEKSKEDLRKKQLREAAARYRAKKKAKQSEEQQEEARKVHADRVAAIRANETPEQHLQRNKAVAIRNAAARANETPEQCLQRNKADAMRKAAARANESHDEHLQRNQAMAERNAAARANESHEEHLQRNQAMAERNAAMRANQSPERQLIERRAARSRMAAVRKYSSAGFQDARRSLDILDGTFKVESLEQTVDTIGEMDVECGYCGALKFRKETPTTCCSGGKVRPEPFPRPPEAIMELWMGNDGRSRLFRAHARQLNNAVCLSSLQVNERNLGGFTPSVVFQGRVHHRAGALLPADGEVPKYAQLYVYDAASECDQRFLNMKIPGTTSNAQKNILKELLQVVQDTLHEVNPYVQDFKQIIDMPPDLIGEGKIVISAKGPSNEHARRYNAPTNLQEVSILMNPGNHDLVLERRGGGLHIVKDLNPSQMPLHFTLLFPYGTHGWDSESKHTESNRRITTREFYAFHLNIRRGDNENYLQKAARLFQEWLCMAWVAVEDQRLKFQDLNQKALRADSYKNVQEATAERMREHELAPREDGLYNDDRQGQWSPIGRKILASSFTGSPRWYNSKFQDGMAICRKYHKPDFFITMTCNPNWPEIKSELLEGQTPQDRPDIVAKVFKFKKDQLINDLTHGGVLGEVVAHMYVIEFQKRGLPHVHILLILADHDRIVTPALVDSVVSAEFPPNPDDTQDPGVREQRQKLQDIVLNSMVHGPCGEGNPNSPCMENGRCTKKFPKEYVKKTIVDPESCYATYQRRSPGDGGRQIEHPKTGRIIDSSWIVPYNPYLSLRYSCHINVECCASPKATKYLFKYVTKGNDRAMVATEVQDQERNEIHEYQDLRSVGSSEATWHLLNFPITDRHPAVKALRVHLKDQQQIVFDAEQEIDALENQRHTELTGFFKFNKDALDNGSNLSELCRYVDMPEDHVYANKEWRLRRRGVPVIGRVHSVNPVAGEVFYLRVLLHDNHCIGKTSFDDMLNLPNGRQCETYKEVCCELGLLNDDREWQRILQEAASTQLCSQIRELYVIILQFCFPSDPRALFEEFWRTWADDMERRGHQQNIDLTEDQLQTMVLLDIELRLESFEKSLGDFGLPIPTKEQLAQVEQVVSVQPAVIREEMDYNLQELADMVEERLPTFTPEQSEVYNTVLSAVRDETPLQAFIDARGGCGKTYLLNAILAAVRSLEPGGCTALAMATTGIAANLLELGRTFHSRMKAPLTAAEDSTLAISGQSSLAQLVRMSKLLLIDEATMLDRYMLEALDRTLRDLLNKPDKPFGDKILILAGDFRQCLPVVQGATRAGIVSHCINQSALWSSFQILRLTQNMRVHASGDPTLEQFDNWTLSLGNGEVDKVKIPEANVATKITPNSKNNRDAEGQAMKEFIGKIFPELRINIQDRHWLEGRAILCAT